MGLEMNLYKRTYVGNPNRSDDDKVRLHNCDLKINENNIVHIDEIVGRWFKANAIHKWFVDNCQDRVDNCRFTIVDHEQLECLLDLCKELLNLDNEGNPHLNLEKAKEELPTCEGTYFGSQEFDDSYIEDLKRTIEIIESILNVEDWDDSNYYYESSW